MSQPAWTELSIVLLNIFPQNTEVKLTVVAEQRQREMAEQEYEQRMRDLQREYVDFLDDSDRDGVYDR